MITNSNLDAGRDASRDARQASSIHSLPAVTLPDESIPPPPYCEVDSDDESDSDTENVAPAIRLTVNAQQVVRGNNNLVPANGAEVAHAAKVSCVLLSALNQLAKTKTLPAVARRYKLNVYLNVNCDIHVIGDRNIVGNVGINQKSVKVHSSAASGAEGNTTTGAKRKADEDDDDDRPVMKRVAVSDDRGASC